METLGLVAIGLIVIGVIIWQVRKSSKKGCCSGCELAKKGNGCEECQAEGHECNQKED